MGRERRKTNKLLTIAVVKGMLSINDDTNAETQTITIIATASWVLSPGSLPTCYRKFKQKKKEFKYLKKGLESKAC